MSKASKSAVWFNEPITLVLDPPEPEARPNHFTHEQIQQIIKNLRNDGYEPRAIVVLNDKYPYWYQEPKNWGIVVDLKTWHRNADPEPYKPILVKWVDGNRDAIGYWPEELILIHKAISIRAIQLIAESQS